MKVQSFRTIRSAYIAFLHRWLSRHSIGRLAHVVFSVVLVFVLFSLVKFTSFHVREKVKWGKPKFSYDRMSPLIFIGGFPRSGTTLMRAMLDAHPDVRCGQETRIIPRILIFHTRFYDETEKERMKEAGVTEEVIDNAMSQFVLDIMANHGESAPRLCTKDPFILTSADYIAKLFPRCKLLFMVRDGRASIHSAIVRSVTIAGYNLSDPRSCLQNWDHSVGQMYSQCTTLGPDRCLLVPYEQLVLHPARWLRNILVFLDLPWADTVLHHDQLIEKEGGIKLSRLEKSSDQIIKPVNIEALTKWVGFYSSDILNDMDKIAPMLAKLGYNPNANPPKYGTPDEIVLENTKLIQSHSGFWKERAKQLHLKKVHIE